MSKDDSLIDGKEFMSIAEAATHFGVARQTISEWLTRYGIKTYPLPRNRAVKMLKVAELARALDEASRPRTDDE